MPRPTTRRFAWIAPALALLVASGTPGADGPAAIKAQGKPEAPPARATRAADDDGPTVMSAEAYAKARGKPGPGYRYGGEPDWAAVSAWRQASFFGVKAEGQVFLFVVDCSGSMADAGRLDRAKRELKRSVAALQFPQRFKVIFYNDEALPMPGALPKPADAGSKNQLARWLDLVEADGGTDPRSALSLAVALKPDAVFLLSDGAFPEGTAEAVGRLNPHKVPIHCVDLGGGAAGDGLRRIAEQSGGRYAARGD